MSAKRCRIDGGSDSASELRGPSSVLRTDTYGQLFSLVNQPLSNPDYLRIYGELHEHIRCDPHITGTDIAGIWETFGMVIRTFYSSIQLPELPSNPTAATPDPLVELYRIGQRIREFDTQIYGFLNTLHFGFMHVRQPLQNWYTLPIVLRTHQELFAWSCTYSLGLIRHWRNTLTQPVWVAPLVRIARLENHLWFLRTLVLDSLQYWKEKSDLPGFHTQSMHTVLNQLWVEHFLVAKLKFPTGLLHMACEALLQSRKALFQAHMTSAFLQNRVGCTRIFFDLARAWTAGESCILETFRVKRNRYLYPQLVARMPYEGLLKQYPQILGSIEPDQVYLELEEWIREDQARDKEALSLLFHAVSDKDELWDRFVTRTSERMVLMGERSINATERTFMEVVRETCGPAKTALMEGRIREWIDEPRWGVNQHMFSCQLLSSHRWREVCGPPLEYEALPSLFQGWVDSIPVPSDQKIHVLLSAGSVEMYVTGPGFRWELLLTPAQAFVLIAIAIHRPGPVLSDKAYELSVVDSLRRTGLVTDSTPPHIRTDLVAFSGRVHMPSKKPKPPRAKSIRLVEQSHVLEAEIIRLVKREPISRARVCEQVLATKRPFSPTLGEVNRAIAALESREYIRIEDPIRIEDHIEDPVLYYIP